MRRRAVIWLGMCMAVVVMSSLALPLEAWAEAAASPAPAAAIAPPSSCDGYVGLTHHIAGCIRDTISKSADRFFTRIYPAFESAIGAVLTLAVLIYGVMLSFGLVEKVGRDTFVLLLKIAAILFFVTNSPWVFKTVLGAMDAAAGAVVSYAPPSGAADNVGSDYSQSVCMKTMVEEQAKADKSKPIITPWLGIDCLIDSVIGIRIPPDATATAAGSQTWFNTTLENADPTKPNRGLTRGLAYFFYSSLQSSVLGVLLSIVGFFFIYGLLSLIVRTFFGYIAGYVGVAVIVILSPLFIPMVLFKETRQYFEKWARLLIGFSLQPVIMLVFVIFSLTAVDLAAFSGSYSIVYQIAGDASRTAPFSLNDYLTTQRDAAGNPDTSDPPCDTCGPIVATKDRSLAQVKAAPKEADIDTRAPVGSRDVGGVVDNIAFSACTPENIAADEANPETTHALKRYCDAHYDIRLPLNNIDWDKLAAAHKPAFTAPQAGTTQAQQAALQVFASVVFCCIVVFILNGVLAIVPAIALDLVGDIAQSPDINSIFSGTLGGSRSGQTNSAISGLAGRLSSLTGSAGRR